MKKFSIPIYFTSFWRRHLQLKKKRPLCKINFVFFISVRFVRFLHYRVLAEIRCALSKGNKCRGLAYRPCAYGSGAERGMT